MSDGGPTEQLLGVDVEEDLDFLPEQVRSLLSSVRFGKFVSVGAVGAVFDTAVFSGVHYGLGASELVAKAAAIETAILVMFLVNEHWTFADEGADERRSFVGRLLRSHLVRAGGSSVQFVIFTALVKLLGVAVVVAGVDVWPLLASFTAIGMAMGVNYVFESLFTWQVHRE